METVKKFTYLGDRVSAGGGYEAAVTARTRCGWVKLRECGELLYGRRFPLKLKRTAYKRYVRPATIYGSEEWSMKESDVVRVICGVQLKNRKISKDLMLGLNESMGQLAMANSFCWYGHVFKVDSHVLKRTLNIEVEGEGMKGRLKRT